MGQFTQTLTKRFAEAILGSQPLHSQSAIVAAQNGVIDWLAVSFLGRHDRGVDKILQILSLEGGAPLVPIIGRQKKSSPSQAALVNGFMAHVLDFDDVHMDVRGHPSAVILPALLSIATVSRTKISGARFLAAYIVGVEAMARLGCSIGEQHYLRGWHNTGTLGTIAAAIAGGYLQQFDITQMQQVIGLAATQASGLRVHFGSETKPLHAGLAAQAAVNSVQFVQAGVQGSKQSFDGELGFLAVYGQGTEQAVDTLLQDWGKDWKISNPGLWFKIYPFCSAAHHAADAAVEIAAQSAFDYRKLKQVEILFPPGGDAALVEREPQTGEQGRFSVEYIVALALMGKPLSLSHFRQHPISSECIRLMKYIKRRYNDKIRPAKQAIPTGRFTIVKVLMKDGQLFEARIDAPRGSPVRPLSRKELEQKLHQAIADDDRANRLLKSIQQLTTLEQITSLFESV